MPVISMLRRFDDLSRLHVYDLKDFNDLANSNGNENIENSGIPKRAIIIDLSGDKNKLEIKAYYGSVQIKLHPVGNLVFENIYGAQYVDDKLTYNGRH